VADDYWDDYVALPDDAAFTRAPLAKTVAAALQINVGHFYGTRVRQLVADCDLWYRAPAPGAGASTEPEYLVSVSEGVTRLWGTIIWVAIDTNPGATAGIDLTFYSERGGAAVGAGNDPVTSATETDTLAAEETPWARAFEVFSLIHQLTPDRPLVGKLFGGSKWIPWEPNLANSNEQRIQVQVEENPPPWNNVQTHVDVWGVFVYEEVPRG